MKPGFAFVVALVVVLASQSHQANLQAISHPPLDSVLRTALVTVLESVNKALNSVGTYGNNYFLEKLQNHTQIKEWSVNIQNGVTTGVTELLFDIINAYRLYVEALHPTDLESKLLDCISDQKDNILTVVHNATTLNGWCNNRLAANLTTAFQETTAAALSVNTEFKSYTSSLKSCLLGDDICIAEFAAKVAKLVKSEASGNSGTISAALKDVIAVYKIMFGQDVPACGKEYFIPILVEGIRKALNEVVSCTVRI